MLAVLLSLAALTGQGPAPVTSAPPAAPAPSALAVLCVGLDGTAEPAVRTRAHALWVDALRGVEGLDVVAVADVSAMLGADVAAALARCADDRCRVAALGALARGPVVLGALDRRGPAALRLDLRVATASAGATVRVSRDVSGAIEPVLIEAAGALFPGRAVRPRAQLTVRVPVDGAAIMVDGVAVGVSPLPAVEVAIGRRTIAASLPDGRHAEASVELSLGGAAEVELGFAVEHSALPYVLGGGALALAGVGIALGAAADATASPWVDACPAGGACAAGFTRLRYDEDADTVALERGLANGLLVAAGAALVGAVVTWVLEGSP